MLEFFLCHRRCVRIEIDVEHILFWNTSALLIVVSDANTQRIEFIDDDRQLMGVNAMFRKLQLNVVRRSTCWRRCAERKQYEDRSGQVLKSSCEIQR